MKLLAAALPALFLAGAAFAQSETPAPTPSEQTNAGEGRGATESEAENPAERQICRRIQTSGTRRMDRVCKTAREWGEYSRQEH